MPRSKRPITAGNIAFELLFTLSYPFLAVFSGAVTLVVWLLSLVSKAVSFVFSKR